MCKNIFCIHIWESKTLKRYSTRKFSLDKLLSMNFWLFYKDWDLMQIFIWDVGICRLLLITFMEFIVLNFEDNAKNNDAPSTPKFQLTISAFFEEKKKNILLTHNKIKKNITWTKTTKTKSKLTIENEKKNISNKHDLREAWLLMFKFFKEI